MEWYKKINYKKFLKDDLLLLEEIVGIDTLMKLYEIFAKTGIYFSEKPIMQMKEEYIRKYFGSKSEKELARELRVSERLVYKIGAQKITLNNQQNLFDDTENNAK
jgi:hypothetical protein